MPTATVSLSPPWWQPGGARRTFRRIAGGPNDTALLERLLEEERRRVFLQSPLPEKPTRFVDWFGIPVAQRSPFLLRSLRLRALVADLKYDPCMLETRPTVAQEIERYLQTGETDPFYAAWSSDLFDGARRAHVDLRAALVREVLGRSAGKPDRPFPDIDVVAFTRRKVEPMVRGLFPRVEQETVLRALEKSVVFLTSENIESILLGTSYERTAWDLANLYLRSVDAPLLSKAGSAPVGLCEATTCYVSTEYFDVGDPFADFIVHEAAHVFHNCKRERLGLPETRTGEWLLNIAFGQRETFAFSCEAYARVLERATSPTHRRALAEEFTSDPCLPKDWVDPAEVASIVREAAAARNGWKVILSRCAPAKRLAARVS